MNPRLRFLVLLSILGITAAAWVWGGFFRETHICTHCGAIQEVRRVMWVPFSETRQTPLSDYLRSLEGADSKPHRWVFAAGHGGPIRCALGTGRELFTVIRSEESVVALKAIRRHRGDAVAAIWTARLLDPKLCREARVALYPLGESNDDFDFSFLTATEDFQQMQQSR